VNWVVVDAKYKDVGSTLAIDDLYQMFAYSHLGAMQDGSQVSRFGIAHPVRDDAWTGQPSVYRRAPDQATSLAIHRVRYPSIDDCRWNWRDYISTQGALFSAFLVPSSPVELTV